MGLFRAIKDSWNKAGPQSYLKATLSRAYSMDLLVGGSPLKLAVSLMDELYRQKPEFLNKRLHPKPPRDEVTATMALMYGIWELGEDSELHGPLLAILEMMTGQSARNIPVSTLTPLESHLLGNAFDYLIETHGPRSAEDAKLLRKNKEAYLGGFAV